MMMLKRSAIIISFLLLASCAHAPQPMAQAVSDDGEQDATPNPHGEMPEEPENLPKIELNSKMLYEFLLGEVSSQRGNPGMAAQIYLNLANSTHDPRVARRAAQLAFEAHEPDKAVEALELWLKLEPNSNQAKQLLVTALLSEGHLLDARPYLVEMLAKYPDKAGHTLLQTYSLIEQNPDKAAVYNLMHDLSQPYPNVAESHLILAQAASSNNNPKLALEEVHRARALKPESEMAVMLEAELTRHDAPGQAIDSLKKYLNSYPDAVQVRLLYARVLLEQHKFTESQTEFQKILNQHPESADLAFTVAMLSLQLGNMDKAEVELKQVLENGGKDTNTVYYYLGQLEEAEKSDNQALQYYRMVQGGEYEYAARLRVVFLLFKANQLNEALDYLHKTEAENTEQRVQLLLVESQLLRDSKQVDVAYRFLTHALEKQPDQPDILYETAMLADQLGKHDIFEQMMRKVIQLKSDNAQAYNALGYSMLDRNEHLQEAMELVEKANKLDPNDAAIMDSVGWGHYRMGDYPKSLEFLRRAYSIVPDPEIAAHLGEVLWMQGDKEQARKIWGEALKSHSDNTALQAVMKKFMP